MRVFGKKRNVVFLILMGCVLFFRFPLFGHADEAYLSNIAVTNTEDHLQIYFKVENCFTQDMKKAIDSGIKTTFNFFIKVYKVRKLWWDNKISEIKISHHVTYDNLKDIYAVTLPERGDEPISVKEFEEVKDLMAGIQGLKITEIQKFQKGEIYQVRLMAELDKVTLPLKLHNVLFFLSLWDFKTDWYTVDFTF